MRWPLLAYLRNWLSAPPLPPPTDPLNRALANWLGSRPAAQLAFSPAEAATEQQLAALWQQAVELGREVNGQRLTSAAALGQLSAAHPQLDRRRLGALLMRAYVDTR